MKIINYDDLSTLNDVLKNAENEDKSEIPALIQKNLGLLESPPAREALRFIRSVKKMDGAGEGVIATAIKTAAISIEHLGKEDIETINQLKEVDETLYKQTLANWIAHHKIPIKELDLTEDQMLALAPHLTYLDLTDGKYDYFNNTLQSCLFTEEFIAKLLENSQKLNEIVLKNCNIGTAVFSRFSKTNSLQSLVIENCPAFNQQLPDGLNSLQKLVVWSCRAYNQKLPDGLKSLQSLKIRKCDALNQLLPDQ